MKFVVCTSFVVMRGRLEFVFFFFFLQLCMLNGSWTMLLIVFWLQTFKELACILYVVQDQKFSILQTSNFTI